MFNSLFSADSFKFDLKSALDKASVNIFGVDTNWFMVLGGVAAGLACAFLVIAACVAIKNSFFSARVEMGGDYDGQIGCGVDGMMNANATYGDGRNASI